MKILLSFLLVAPFLTTADPVVAQESDQPEVAALKAWRVICQSDESDDALTTLRKQIIEALANEIETRMQRVRSGQIEMHVLLDGMGRINSAITQLAANNAEKTAWLEVSLPMSTMVEEWQQELFDAGVAHADNLYQARAFRLALELQILELKRQLSEEEAEEVRELREQLR